MKKLLVLFIMLLIAFSAFGTGQQAVASGEPETVTYKSYTGPIEEDLNYSNSSLGKYILEEFNAKIEIWPASETTYREELITDAATDSLPDMLTIWVYPNAPEEILVVQKAAKEGLLAGLNDAIDKYAPTIKKAVTTTENYPIYTQEYMADPDFKGETYFLPGNYTVGTKKPPGWAFVIREDVRKQLGLKTPIYMDDPDQFLDILRKIKALNPKDINGNPAWATGGIRIWNVLMATYTRLYDWGGSGGVDVDSNGKLVHYFQTDYPWEQILFMRKLFEEGLMDPEALTHTFEVGKEKVAQGKYIVEPFFAGGGTDWSYHKVTTDADPNMNYNVMGSFYTNKGKPGPLLVNNIGMQTHFLSAVSKNANLDVVMPIIEYFATPEGTAANAYGARGVTWDWDSSGKNAVLKPEYVDDYLFVTAEVPSPWYVAHGTGPWGFMASIPGVNLPSQMVFNGTEKPRYPLDSYRDDEMAKRIKEATNGIGPNGLLTENKMSLASFMESYPKKDSVSELLAIPYYNTTLMYPAYLAADEATARELYENYVDAVNKAGLADYMKYLQKIYDADPDKYLLYESMGG